MSLTIALALCMDQPKYPKGHRILNLLSIPEFVKEDLQGRFMPYLHAIELDGYDMRKIRKMIVLGNKGTLES